MSALLIAGSCLLASYVSASVILLRYPLLLHKRKQIAFPPCTHISHRGGAGEHIENTMSAFRHAVNECGTNMLEIDCQLTRDGRVVVAHDSHLARLCDVDAHTHDYDYMELPLLRNEMPLQFDSDWVTVVEEDGDRRIPLLEDVFKEFPDLPINLDPKNRDREIMIKISNLIRDYKRESLTPWGNYQDVITQACYKHNPNIPLITSLRQCAKIVALYYTGLLPFVPIKESFVEIAPPFTLSERHNHRMRTDNWKLYWVLRFMNVVLMRRCLLEHLKRRGMHVYMWVVNDEDHFRRAFDVGASGVMTDYPTKLRRFLDNNPQYDQRKTEF